MILPKRIQKNGLLWGLAVMLLVACRPEHEPPPVPDPDPVPEPIVEPVHIEADDALPDDYAMRMVAPSVSEVQALLAFVGRRLYRPLWRESYHQGIAGDMIDTLDSPGIDTARPMGFAILSFTPFAWMAILPCDDTETVVQYAAPKWPDSSIATSDAAGLVFLGNDIAAITATRERVEGLQDAQSPRNREEPVWYGDIRTEELPPLWEDFVGEPIRTAYPEALPWLSPALDHIQHQLGGLEPVRVRFSFEDRRTELLLTTGTTDSYHIKPSHPPVQQIEPEAWITMRLSPERTNLIGAVLRSLAAATADVNVIANTERLLSTWTDVGTAAQTDDGSWLLLMNTTDTDTARSVLQDTLPPDPDMPQFDLGGVLVDYVRIGDIRLSYAIEGQVLALAGGPSLEQVLIEALHGSTHLESESTLFSGSLRNDTPVLAEPFWLTDEEGRELLRTGGRAIERVDWDLREIDDGFQANLVIDWGAPVDVLGSE